MRTTQAHYLAATVSFPVERIMQCVKRAHYLATQPWPCPFSYAICYRSYGAIFMAYDDMNGFAGKTTIKKWAYQPDTLRGLRISTAIEVVPSTALPTPSYPDTGHRSSTNQKEAPQHVRRITFAGRCYDARPFTKRILNRKKSAREQASNQSRAVKATDQSEDVWLDIWKLDLFKWKKKN